MVVAGLMLASLAGVVRGEEKVRRLPVKEYLDKMKGGWLGQMAGVGWGAPTEFRWQAAIIPEDKMPPWSPAMVNQHGNDDLYVEMTFLRTLEQYGLGVSIRQAGIDWANSGYQLWHANKAGRDNLRAGIAPPDSGHPRFNKHADDIDYQIEADFSGLIAPGLPNTAIALGEVFGRLMNYGDGLYGGQLVGGMYTEAFFETDPVKIVRFGLQCIPEKSQYAECIRDVLRWYEEDSADWQKTWQKVEDKYQKNPDYRRFSCDKGKFNIDAKLNGAYIVMGLLYGKGDLDKTMLIACRCGQDSDCNPSNAGGVLFTTIGASKVPERFTRELKIDGKFSYSDYALPKVYEVCEKLARQAVNKAGGRIERAGGEEVFVIPVQQPKPGKLQQCWEPGPAADSKFTAEEMKQITAKADSPKPKKKAKKKQTSEVSKTSEVSAKIPVILDTDIGGDIDDTWALALLLKSPEVELKMVVSDYGDTPYRARIIAKLLEVAKRTDVQVGIGIRQDEKGGPQAQWVAGYDLARYPGKVHKDGVGAMIDLVMNSKEKITLICIGPVPNIQAALERKPEIATRARFVGMHGSVRLGYDGKPQPNAEWNVVANPKAAQKVFAAAWPMTITPLDTCGLVRLKGEKYRKIAECKDPLTRAVIENYEIWHKAGNPQHTGKIEASSVLFDTVAIYLAFTDKLVNIERLPIRVTDDGFTRIDPKGKQVDCAMSWKDLGAYEDFLVGRFTGK
jgi:inosine-uridine nucleoside N-ribohydrolase